MFTRSNKLAKDKKSDNQRLASEKTFIEPDEEMKDDEIIGVRVINEPMPNPLAKPEVEEPKPEETKEQPKALPDPKKKVQKKGLQHREEGAFQTYIFRVCKEVTPDTGISKKAMTTLNQIIADKFEAIMTESRGLIIKYKHS